MARPRKTDTDASEQPKKRGRKPKEIELQRTADYTPEQQAEARDRAVAALGKWRSQQAAARSAKKGVDVEIETLRKMTGLSKKAIFAGLLATERDPDELTAEMREQNQALRIMGVPVGTQLGLFDDGRTVATAIEDDRGADHFMDSPTNIKRARKEGEEAGLGNVDLVKGNPYAEGSQCHAAFRGAWQEAQDKLARRFEAPSDRQPALQ